MLGALLGLDFSSPGNQASTTGWPLADIGDLDQMVMGDGDLGDEMILGAALTAKSPEAKQALIRAIRNRKMKDASLVTPRSAAESNLQPLGFEFLAIAAGADALVTTQPQTLFKPTRLMVPTTIAPAFVLKDVKVGNVSQLPSANPIPCESFVPGAFGAGLALRTVNPAINLSLLVNNISGDVQDFRATFFGISVQ